MSSQYVIKTQKSADPGIIVELDKNPYLAIPVHLLTGVMSKQTRINKLADFYSKAFVSSEEKYLGFRYTVSNIHKLAKEKNGLTLLCSSKNKEVHQNGFIKFIKDNYETIDVLFNYINEGLPTTEQGAANFNAGSNGEAVARKIGDPVLDSFELRGQGLDKLSDDDIRQIKTLMLNGDHMDSAIEQDLNITDVEAKEVKND